MTSSPYAQVGAKLVDSGFAAIPCRPGSKVPGAYRSGEWFYESEWQRFCDRLPTELELGVWAKWPDAGICVALGGEHGLVAIDIDTDQHEIVEAILGALPCESPVQKCGKKGATHFFRASAAVKSRAFNVGADERVLDLLCRGKQTVIPPTRHPETERPYEWITPDTLVHVTPERLPMLPDDIAERIAAALKPFGYEPEVERSEPLGGGSGTGREVNDAALANLDCWVGDLGIDAKRQRNGTWRGRAVWKGAENANVGFSSTGIKDWGEDRGMTPIDVTMESLNMDFGDAVDWLKARLGFEEPPRAEFTFRKPVEVDAPPSPEPDCDEQPAGEPETVDIYLDDTFVAGIISASERFPAEVFWRHFIDAAIAIGPKFDEADFTAEVSHIADWMAGAVHVLAEACVEQPEVEAESVDSIDPFDHKFAGGLLQTTAEWIMSTSFVPSRELSLLAAIGIMAAFISRRYVGPTGLSPNLYLVGLASTGAGKDAPLAAVKTIFLGHGSSEMRGMLGSGDLTSGPAIQRLVRARPASISPIDEIGAWMQDGAARNASAFARTRRKAMLELYTSSKRNGIYLGRDSAGEEEMSSDYPIHSPCFSILGMSTEEAFFKGISEENLSDGYLNRLTMIHIPPVEERRRRMEAPEMPHELKIAFDAAFEAWSIRDPIGRRWFAKPELRPAFHVVPWADGAEAAYDNVWDRQQAFIKADPGSEGVIRRAAEQALKLAMIRAVSRDFKTPAITVEDVEFGAAIAFKSVNMLLDGIKRYMSGSDFEDACKAMLRHVEAAGAKGLTAVKLRRRSGVSKLKPNDFRDAVKHLTEMGDWRLLTKFRLASHRGARLLSPRT